MGTSDEAGEHVPSGAGVRAFDDPSPSDFEQVRNDQFAGKPSRLSSCFGLPTQADADLYRQQVDPNFQMVLHEVEVVDNALPQHTGNIAFLDFRDGTPFLDPTRMAARSYWNGEPTPGRAMEIVTTSAFRVLHCLE